MKDVNEMTVEELKGHLNDLLDAVALDAKNDFEVFITALNSLRDVVDSKVTGKTFIGSDTYEKLKSNSFNSNFSRCPHARGKLQEIFYPTFNILVERMGWND